MDRTLIVGMDPRAGHNYGEALLQLLASGALADLKRGSAYRLTVIHDDSCGIFRGARCDCEPEFELMETT